MDYYLEILKRQLRRYKLVETTESDREHTVKVVKNFFIKNPEATLEDVKSFSEKVGLPLEKFLNVAFRLLSHVLTVGKHRGVPDEKFDAKQLNMGIEVEKEHTDDPEVAKQIAKDHLAECPWYYTYLAKMEKRCEEKMEKTK